MSRRLILRHVNHYNSLFLKAVSILVLAVSSVLTAAGAVGDPYPAPMIVGSDPGGKDTLRVGGSISSGVIFDALVPNPNLAAGYNAMVNVGVPGSRSRTFRFIDRAYIDFELIQGGRGILHFGTDFGGRNNVLSLNTNTGSAIIGADPGGADKLRVGGTVGAKGYVSGGVYDASAVNSALPGGFNAAIAATTPGQRSRPISFSDRAYIDFELIQGGRGILHFGTDFSGRNNVLSLNTNTGSAIIGADPGGSGQLRVGGGADFKGTVRAKEVVVTLNGWSDHVFAPDYQLASLSEVAAHIESKRHLPGIPAESEIIEKGLSMGEMQRLHMAKIEELTLYAIQADRVAATQHKLLQEVVAKQAATEVQNQRLERENLALAERLERIEKALAIPTTSSATQP